MTESALNKQVDGNHYKDMAIQPIIYIYANQKIVLISLTSSRLNNLLFITLFIKK